MPFLAINMDGIMDWKEGGQITMSEVKEGVIKSAT